jgi:hypothetical protein
MREGEFGRVRVRGRIKEEGFGMDSSVSPGCIDCADRSAPTEPR